MSWSAWAFVNFLSRSSAFTWLMNAVSLPAFALAFGADVIELTC